MTANQITLLVAPVVVVLIAVVLFYRASKARSNRPQQTHAPHAPGSGTDPVEAARSKMQGDGSRS